MKAQRHKTRLLNLLEKLKDEVCSLLEEEHLQYPYKSLIEVERDIDNLIQEVDRTGLAK